MAALAACGQKGALYLPNDPAAATRASLPQTLKPIQSVPSSLPAVAASAPSNAPDAAPASKLPSPPEPQ